MPDPCKELELHANKLIPAYNLPNGVLYFTRLKGGIANAPIYAYMLLGRTMLPVAVFKREDDDIAFTNARFAAIEEMTAQGYPFHPVIFKNRQGAYLTKINGHYYSAIEYIQPDAGKLEETLNLQAMLRLTARFHHYAKNVTAKPILYKSRYELHIARAGITNELDTFPVGVDFFKCEKFQRVLQLYRYYSSPAVKQLFERLPKQFIHGDNHQHNLVYRDGKAYNVDLDTRRFDLRLYDFTSFVRHASPKIQDEYDALVATDRLFDVISEHYGELTEDEVKHFHLVVGFTYIENFSWMLNRIKELMAAGKEADTVPLMSRIVARTDKVIALLDAGLIQIKHAQARSRGTLFYDTRTSVQAANLYNNADTLNRTIRY